MKKSEIALLILIVGIVGIITYFILNSALAGLKPKPEEVLTAKEISSTLMDMETLSSTVFVEGAYNPTIKVTIGDQANQQPFNATQR